MQKVSFMSFGIKMNKISKFFRKISNVIKLIRIGIIDKEITVYSEGRDYWSHLESLVLTILNDSDLSICFITSSENDPAFDIKHSKFNCFYIGDGILRDFVFQSLNTKVVVLTMPDLNQFTVKRSRHEVHYVYVQHSLVSLHMIYRDGAFNYYDTICCAGPHHVREFRAIEEKFNLTKKNILEHGYSKLDNLINNNLIQQEKNKIESFEFKKILIAPSWGPSCLIESGLCINLIEDLISSGYEVILRPHPETIKRNYSKIEEIMDLRLKESTFHIDQDLSGLSSFKESDLMISDWSGVALEYSLAFFKPVIFCELPRKINNPNYKDIKIEPLEVKIRQEIGMIWDCSTPIDEKIKSCKNISKERILEIRDKYIFNSGSSDYVLKDYLLKNFYS